VSRGEFPSGHTAAMGLYVGTAVLLLARGRLRAVGLVAVGLLACLIGTALVYDRFHWLSDVVGSLLLAPALLWWVASTPAMARHDAAETARARSGGPAAVPARRRITSPATDPRSPS
jgi:membrane-associated phospholipid phosphatase